MRVTEYNLGQVAKTASAAHDNEQVTRVRVEALEKGLTGVAGEMSEFVGRSFVDRLKWLFLGR